MEIEQFANIAPSPQNRTLPLLLRSQMLALMVMVDVEVELRDLVDLTVEVALEVIDLVVVDLKVIGLNVDIRGAGGLGARGVGQMAPMLKPRLGDMYQEESEEDGESSINSYYWYHNKESELCIKQSFSHCARKDVDGQRK